MDYSTPLSEIYAASEMNHFYLERDIDKHVQLKKDTRLLWPHLIERELSNLPIVNDKATQTEQPMVKDTFTQVYIQ